MLSSSSPKLFAGFASFIACWCQGIHQQPLLAWPKNYVQAIELQFYLISPIDLEAFPLKIQRESLFKKKIPQASIFVSDLKKNFPLLDLDSFAFQDAWQW
jgi:hypothetical protein